MAAPLADVGVFGGSGLYRFLRDVEEIVVETPWGPPSAPVAIGVLGDRRVAFLPRHGREHTLPPHRVPYRANIWAMRELGVGAVLSPFAAGSLQRGIVPGDVVVCDQLVDRTWGRPDTFYDSFDDGPVHASLADPYDAGLRDAVIGVAGEHGLPTHPQGTVVVIQGPRFNTRAESRWYSDAGWHVVNMTQYPEAALAREAGLPFCGIALVTDHDAGVDGIEPVTQATVFEVFERNVERVRALLAAAIPRVPLPARSQVAGRNSDAGKFALVALFLFHTMIESTTLPAEPTSAAAARARVARTVPDGDPRERAVLLTSELVSNVVLHARTPVELTVRRDGRMLRVEVGDESPAAPIVKGYDRHAVTGRGLQLVSALADRWGIEPKVEGKVVWFEIDLGADDDG